MSELTPDAFALVIFDWKLSFWNSYIFLGCILLMPCFLSSSITLQFSFWASNMPIMEIFIPQPRVLALCGQKEESPEERKLHIWAHAQGHCMIYSYSSLPCPVRGSWFTNPTCLSAFCLHFDQVSSRFLATMGSHLANFIPILLLPINDVLDAMMNEKKSSQLNILDEYIVWILMHHLKILPLWIVLTMDLFLILTTFINSQSLAFWGCHLSPVGDLLDANDGKRELTENLWRPSYTCLRHILSTSPLPMSFDDRPSAHSADPFLIVDLFSCCKPCRYMWVPNVNLRVANDE